MFRWRVGSFAVRALASALGLAGLLPVPALEPVTVCSQSGQFVVRGLPWVAPMSGASTSAVSFLRLDPTVTAVSLERIRQAVAAELGLGNRWRGLVNVTTQPTREDNARILVTAIHYADGWGYQVELPEIVEKQRFLRVAVRVILLEFANRTAVVREAELPPWLVEGLAAELEATSPATLALGPRSSVADQGINADVLRRPRELLRRRPAITFTELSMPDENLMSGEEAALYQACAHLFVHDLLRLRNGREALRNMLIRLPENLNWQTTFLAAFETQFSRLVEVDKWYALKAALLAGRDPASVWPFDISLRQFDEILGTAVEVRTERSELPINTRVKLQRVIAEWEFPQQARVLEQKMSHLEALRFRAAPELAELVGEYWRALDAYLQKRSNLPADAQSQKIPFRPSGKAAIREVSKRLDALDKKLETLRTLTPEKARAE